MPTQEKYWSRLGVFFALILWSSFIFVVCIGMDLSSNFREPLARLREVLISGQDDLPVLSQMEITNTQVSSSPQIVDNPKIFDSVKYQLGNHSIPIFSKSTQSPTKIDIPSTKSVSDIKVEHFRDRFSKRYYSIQRGIGKDNETTNKYFIYRCDVNSMRNCGGWADRIKGIMTAYIIANLTGRIFKSEMLSPPSCDMLRNLMPNQVNWSLPNSFHKTVKRSTEVQVINFMDNIYSVRRMRSLNFDSMPQMKAKYVYFKSNLDYMMEFQAHRIYPQSTSWMRGLSRDKINAAVFRRLFKLSPQLQTKLSGFLKKNLASNSSLICVHARCGRTSTIPFDSAVRLREAAVPKLWNFLQNISKESFSKIFLMTDSEKVIASAQKQPFKDKIFVTPGKVVHVERSRDSSTEDKCVGFEKVILEQFVLMHCDTLVVGMSGLSRMAAYVRGSDKGLFCLMNDGRVLPCKNKDIQKVYHVVG